MLSAQETTRGTREWYTVHKPILEMEAGGKGAGDSESAIFGNKGLMTHTCSILSLRQGAGEPTGLPALLSTSLGFSSPQELFCDLPTRDSAEVGVEKAELTSELDTSGRFLPSLGHWASFWLKGFLVKQRLCMTSSIGTVTNCVVLKL